MNVGREDVTLSLFNLPCVTCRMYVLLPSKHNGLNKADMLTKVPVTLLIDQVISLFRIIIISYS